VTPAQSARKYITHICNLAMW